MKKINLLYGIWFGAIIGILVNLSMNFIYFVDGNISSFLMTITISALIGIFVSLSGDGVYYILKKLKVENYRVRIFFSYFYYAFITVVICYVFNVKDIKIVSVAVAVVIIPSVSISYLDSMRAKELNQSLNVAKEKFKKVQE